VAAHPPKDFGFLLRTPHEGNDGRTDSAVERLVEHQLDNLSLAGGKVNDSLDPELGLLVQPKSALPAMPPHQLVVAVKPQDVAGIDRHECRRVLKNRDIAVRRPFGYFCDALL
jgi:hypothetical protein